MKVVIGYRNEERLKAALPLFKPGNAGVHADQARRDGSCRLGQVASPRSTASSATCISS